MARGRKYKPPLYRARVLIAPRFRDIPLFNNKLSSAYIVVPVCTQLYVQVSL